MGSILPCCLPYGKAGGLQILGCQGIAVGYYSVTLDVLALKPSDFSNVGVQANLSSFYIDLAEMVYFHIRKTSNSVRG